jgi:hypothetical protein
MIKVPLLRLPLVFLCLVSLVSASIPRACSTPDTSQFPFCNPKLTLNARVDDLVSRLQSDEKPPLLTARMSPLGNVSRLGMCLFHNGCRYGCCPCFISTCDAGLPEYDWGANCVHGVQSRCGTKWYAVQLQLSVSRC